MVAVPKCPYCFMGGQPRPLILQQPGKLLMCEGCGHKVLPGSPAFQCICHNCKRLKRRRVRRRII